MITNIKDNFTCVNADCFDYFPNIKDNSVDMILCDLHFGNSTTFFIKNHSFLKK